MEEDSQAKPLYKGYIFILLNIHQTKTHCFNLLLFLSIDFLAYLQTISEKCEALAPHLYNLRSDNDPDPGKSTILQSFLTKNIYYLQLKSFFIQLKNQSRKLTIFLQQMIMHS